MWDNADDPLGDCDTVQNAVVWGCHLIVKAKVKYVFWGNSNHIILTDPEMFRVIL